MKRNTMLFFLMSFVVIALLRGQEIPGLTLPAGGNGVSEHAEVAQWIGPVRISIDYHSPNVHRRGVDRTGHIWGELIPFGFFDDGHGPSRTTPWRAGANETTRIAFSHDVEVEGRPVKAGTYGLFLVVQKDGPWTWILSSAATGWGSYQYDPVNDVLRATVDPQTAQFTESLMYGFDDRGADRAVAFLQWENKRIPLHIVVPQVNDYYVAELRRELLAWPGFNYENWRRAAQFCASRRINLEEALVWADKAISEPFRGAGTGGRVEFATLSTKAAVLEAMGRTGEADAVMKKAIDATGADAMSLYAYERSLLSAGRKQEALQLSLFNQQRHASEPFWTYVGLAEGYAAAGDRAKAMANWDVAVKNVPESEKNDLEDYRRRIDALIANRSF
ncbi:MAG: DUF2911 domain-containing protein [Thermoanaerobaculia bacterium]